MGILKSIAQKQGHGKLFTASIELTKRNGAFINGFDMRSPLSRFLPCLLVALSFLCGAQENLPPITIEGTQSSLEEELDESSEHRPLEPKEHPHAIAAEAWCLSRLNVIRQAHGDRIRGIITRYEEGANRLIRLVLDEGDTAGAVAWRTWSVRIEIVSWHGHGGGLSEVRLVQRDTDLLDQGRVEVSAEHSPQFGGGKLRDGVLNSDRFEAGDWLLPSNRPGWVDLHLYNR